VKRVVKKERVLVGFRERAARFLADLHGCEVLSPPVDRLIDPLAELIGSLSISDRVPQVEVAVADSDCALVFRVLSPLATADLESLRAFARAHALQIYLQPGGPDTVEPLDEERYPLLHYELPEFGIRLEFRPTDFVQVNADLNAAMLHRALELLGIGSSDAVLDLFCGIGNFSLPLARSAATVVGVEGTPALVERAEHNARINSIDNAAFHAANLAQDVGEHSWAKRNYDLVLLDPPRAGAREVLPVVARSGARRVMYISCHPGSLARDAGILVHDFGFRLTRAGVMDMFPHTAHVEAMAVFDA
jgi:23S rRNA (uracil1939-C5)-methyltransferase